MAATSMILNSENLKGERSSIILNLDQITPAAIKDRLGTKNWDTFKQALAYTIQEYATNPKEIIEFLKKKLDGIDYLVNYILKKNLTGGEVSKEELYHMVVSNFVSAYIHNIDPYFLSTFPHIESHYRNWLISSAGAAGFMQPGRQFAGTEFFNPKQGSIHVKKFKDILEELGGKQFKGFARVAKVTLKDGDLHKPEMKKEDYRWLVGMPSNPLYNSIWCARTLLLKLGYEYVQRAVRRSGYDNLSEALLKSRQVQKRFAERYAGEGERAENYGQRIVKLYRTIYKPMEHVSAADKIIQEAEEAMKKAIEQRPKRRVRMGGTD